MTLHSDGDDAKPIAEIGDSSVDAITRSKDGAVVEAELATGRLGLSLDTSWREMKRGVVYGVVETRRRR
jgi:hypothetical protein